MILSQETKHDPHSDRITYVFTKASDLHTYKVGFYRGIAVGLFIGFLITNLIIWQG